MLKLIVSYFYLLFKGFNVSFFTYGMPIKLNIYSNSPKKCKLNKCKLSGNIKLGNYTFIDENANIRGEVVIGEYTSINKNVEIMGNISIGKYCAFARNSSIITFGHNLNKLAIDHRFYKELFNSPPHLTNGKIDIGNDVWIGTKVLILGNVNIGSGSIIAAGSVVTKNIPPYSIVAGVPAKVIKNRFSKEKIEILLKIKWWDWSKDKIIKNKHLFDVDIEEIENCILEKANDE